MVDTLILRCFQRVCVRVHVLVRVCTCVYSRIYRKNDKQTGQVVTIGKKYMSVLCTGLIFATFLLD